MPSQLEDVVDSPVHNNGGTMTDQAERLSAIALIDEQLNDLPNSELMKVALVFDMLLDLRNEFSREA